MAGKPAKKPAKKGRPSTFTPAKPLREGDKVRLTNGEVQAVAAVHKGQSDKKAKSPRKAATPKKSNKGGRPSKYTPKLVEDICARLAKGEPLAVICRDEKMPGVTTLWEWGKARSEVSEAIARAREDGFDHLAAECLEIAEDGSGDYVLSKTGPLVDHEHVARSKLRIETRLKLLAKWDPKRYGDKVQLADADGNKLPDPPQFMVMPVMPKPAE